MQRSKRCPLSTELDKQALGFVTQHEKCRCHEEHDLTEAWSSEWILMEEKRLIITMGQITQA